ncbi:MAG: hypothetical protein ABIS45_13225 [Burkholderiales bacterium]
MSNIRIKQNARGRRKVVEINAVGLAIVATLANMNASCPTN